jgi:CRISPR-associated protein Cas1
MVNEFVYCPRLFWLEYVEREFADSFDTVDGERVHRRVDRARGELPDDIAQMKGDVTSVELASERLGVVAKIDLIRGGIPIDFKRGRAPDIENGAYDPERVQVCIQALLLREHGYPCDRARLYYAASKRFVDVLIDEALVEQTLAAVQQARALRARGSIPPPLTNSPKCARCSLNAICLPDEVHALQAQVRDADIRPFAAPADDRAWLYVMEHGMRVGLSGETIQVKAESGIKAQMPLIEVGGVSLFGTAQISSQATHALLLRDAPIFLLSFGGWLNGYIRSANDHSIDLRIAQHKAVQDVGNTLDFARCFVLGKVKNQRTMIRRALGDDARQTLQALSLICHRIQTAADVEGLLGYEGTAARYYFDAFAQMLRVHTGFEVNGRARRPPTDPVNAMLSFGYSMLVKECVAAAVAVGFEPGLGFYHKLRPGRPSLALDLMEEFRPLIVDSTVLSLVNAREIKASHFDRRGRAIVLTDEGRRTFIAAIERRLHSSITHPTFGYTVTYRRALHVQARLLARAVQGDVPAYPPFTTR